MGMQLMLFPHHPKSHSHLLPTVVSGGDEVPTTIAQVLQPLPCSMSLWPAFNSSHALGVQTTHQLSCGLFLREKIHNPSTFLVPAQWSEETPRYPWITLHP